MKKATLKATKASKTPKTTTAELPKHKQASAKIQRFAKRMNRLIVKFGKYGAPVTEALATAKAAFEGAVKHLDALPADFEPPAREQKAKAAPAEKAPSANQKVKAPRVKA